MRRTTGFSLFEMVVSLAVSLLVAGALFKVFVNSTQSQLVVTSQNDAETEARQPLDSLVDHLRNAQSVSGEGGAVIKSGTATSVEYYASNSTTDVVKYFLSGTDLMRQVGTAAATTAMTNVQELEFRYFKAATSPPKYYTDIVPTADPNAPATSDGGEYHLLAVIEVRVVANIDGYTRELNGIVRLRNSPIKKRL